MATPFGGKKENQGLTNENSVDFYRADVGTDDIEELSVTEVIDLQKAREEREPHIAGALYCMGCSHEWTAVWKPGTTEFECPECKSMRGRNKFDVMPALDAQSWTCVACGNQLFHLLRDRVHCPGCGKQWGYAEIS